MSPMIYRVAIWFGLLLLCVLVLVSCVQERAGFERFHEIACTGGPQRLCQPTGRQVALTRKPGDSLARPARLPSVRVEVYAASGLLESHTDQAFCSLPDAHNFACRQLLRAGGTGNNAEPAPWRQVQGSLFNDAVAPDRIVYLNGLQFWRNRLLFGDFER
jgi:hypothetical protein